MNYAQLAARISRFTPEQLAADVTMYVPGDEYYPCVLGFATVSNDVLDEWHPYLISVGQRIKER
jgi:hypothetical protein